MSQQPITERAIQNHVARWTRNRWELILPNYTPRDWFECDLFCVTRSGYLHEHEIKVSVADFRADAKKAPRRYRFGRGMVAEPEAGKHLRLAARDEAGPSRFSYIVPVGMIEPGDVPEWAGLKFFDDRRAYLDEVKPAPRLHRVKVDEAVIEHARGVCYYRFWNERLRTPARPPAGDKENDDGR